MKNFNDVIFRQLTVMVFTFLLFLIPGILSAQNSNDMLSGELSCFSDTTSIEFLRDYVNKKPVNDSICYLEALSVLELLDNENGSGNSFLISDEPVITIGMLFESILKPTLLTQQNTERVGTKKKVATRSRSGRGLGGTNSIRIDQEDDYPYNTYTPAQLVEEVLVTGCLTADNVTFQGGAMQIGYFNSGDADFPFEEGIVLSTGDVVDGMGPNTLTNTTTEVLSAGDAQLQAIAGSGNIVYDASVLEFDFVPAGDTVNFSYIFASEEYPEYACSNYNDVFGFFVTSVDDDGIGYDNENVAVLPDESIVSINNVHGAGRGDGVLSYSLDGSYPNPNGCSIVTNTIGGYYLQEGFESGAIPQGWSEILYSGNVSWQVLGSGNSNNLLNPHSGAYNASFYGSSAATMLVTPEIALNSNLDNYLSFWHAQPRHNNTNGTLTIYYKNSEAGNWTEIEIYDNREDNWVNNILLLPDPSSTYQIGFLAANTDSDETGVVLDDVNVYYYDLETYSDFLSFNTNCPASNVDYYVDQSAYVHEYGAGGCVQTVRWGVENPYTLFENIEADGRTVKLTATFVAVPCSTYHIKLAVGDVRDRKWDSWVFLEANSFQSNDIELTASSNGVVGETAIFEGCKNSTNFFVVSRVISDASQELVVNVDYSPAGVNGGQILQLDDNLLPETIVIPVGQMSDTVYFYAIDDGIPENPQDNSITLTFYTGCPCDPEPTSIDLGFQIYDVLDLTNMEITANNVECNGESNGVIIASPTGGSGTFEYMLSGAESRPWQISNTFNGLATGTYNVTVRDEQHLLNCNDPITVSDVYISEPEPIVAEAGSNKSLCFGQTTTLNGSGGVQFSWSPTDWLSDPNSSTPTVSPSGVTNSPVVKEYTLTTTDANGYCPDTDQVTVTVYPTPDVSIHVDGTPLSSINACPDDDTTLEAFITPETNTGTETYLWSNGATTSAITVSPNQSKNYSVTVTNGDGCTKNAQINVLVYPFEVSSQVDQMNVCPNDQDGIVSIILSGNSGNLPVTVLLTGPPGFAGQTITFTETGTQNVTGLITGNYSVTGTSSAPAGCTSTATFEILSVDDLPPTLTCPASVVETAPLEQTSMNVTLTEPTVSDNCSATQNIVVSGIRSDGLQFTDPYPLGNTTITYTAKDEAGNEAYCDHIVNVKSSSSPGDVDGGLVLWLKANAGVYNESAPANTNEPVSLWDDHFLNNDAVQNTSGLKPLLSTNSNDLVNHNPVIQYDGNDDFLLSDLSSLGLETENTVFIVSKPESTGAVVGIGTNSFVGFRQNGVVYSINGGASVTQTEAGSYSLNDIKVVSLLKSGNENGDISIFINGIEPIKSQNQSAIITGTSDTRIGAGNTSNSTEFLQGDIAEVIIYNRVLTEAERKKAESYLALKYGITLGD